MLNIKKIWNWFKFTLRRFAIWIYVILTTLLSTCIWLFPQANRIIAVLTFFTQISILALYFRVTHYISASGEAKSSGSANAKIVKN